MNSHISEEIAIIGMACRFPKSETPQAFWKHIVEGTEMISHFTDDELLAEGIDLETLRSPNYVKAKGYVPGIENFDLQLFSFTKKEVASMDPQQRLLMECVWEAFEDGCTIPDSIDGNIGVFVGGNTSQYFLNHLYPRVLAGEENDMAALVGNGSDYLATRLSYQFGLNGPSETIQTACSTSLTAVHHACQCLLNFQCDLAVAGGVSLTLPNKHGYIYTPESIFSPDGHCRVFDADSKGTVFSDGAGVVLLKRLEEALRDGDRILAIIKGSALNNDGNRKVGFFAPSVQGQAAVIAQALANAEVDPSTISYIETHGTGTLLGDPIEISALKEAFGVYTQGKTFCALGALKSLTGHLNTAAGIAGLIKTILALQHREIPPLPLLDQPNPQIAFSETPFYLPKLKQAWEKKSNPRRAGVSAFGIGGTNVHLILEEAPSTVEEKFPPPYLFPFSAATADSLKQHIENVIAFLAKNPTLSLARAAFSLQMGRRVLTFRKVFVVDSLEDLKKQAFSQESISSKYAALEAIAQQWEQIGEFNWCSLYAGQVPGACSLPTYPFQRERVWLERIETASLPVKPTLSLQTHGDLLESIVLHLWQKHIGADAIASSDDFFQSGGDSLTAIHIAEDLRELLGIELSLTDFFSNGRFDAFCSQIRRELEKRNAVLLATNST